MEDSRWPRFSSGYRTVEEEQGSNIMEETSTELHEKQKQEINYGRI